MHIFNPKTPNNSLETLPKESFNFNDIELKKIYSREFLDFIFIRPFYSISKTEEKLGIHRNTASSYLNLLKSKGIFESSKFGKNKIFYYKDFFELLK